MSQQLILAIGRESGSGGLDIARLLAERFGLPLYDKNILQTAAQERGVSPEKLTRYDEQPHSPLFYRSVRGYSNAPEDAVAQLQFRLLREHAEAGESFVVLGRCCEEVLADPARPRVRFHPGGPAVPDKPHALAGGGGYRVHQKAGPAAAGLS